MGWKELSEKLKEAVEDKGVSTEELGKYLDVKPDEVRKILDGDLSFTDRAHAHEYLKRLSWILDLDFEELWKEFESEVFEEFERSEENSHWKLETVIALILAALSIFLTFEIRSTSYKPYAVMENLSRTDVKVDGIYLKPGETYQIYKNVEVHGNHGSVIIRTFGKKVYEVKIRDFEVIIDGRD